MQCANIQRKAFRTNEARYGTKYSIAAKSTRQKIEEYFLLAYDASSFFGSSAFVDKSLLKYGTKYPCQNIEVRSRIIETRKRNGTFGKSKDEDIAYNALHFIFPHLIRQYKSDRYPFYCDFYDPIDDIFFEYNGFMTHGGHFFDADNDKDLAKLEQWKSKVAEHPIYMAAIDCWTRRDVKKLEIARQNDLNYVVFWKLKEVFNYVLSYFD